MNEREDDEEAQREDPRLQREESPELYGGAFARQLGVQYDHAAAGRSRLHLRIRPEFLNSAGNLHGGILSALVDMAVGAAIRSSLRENPGRAPSGSVQPGSETGATTSGDERPDRRATVDLNVTFLRPIRGGTVVAEGWILRRGRSLISGEAEILNDQGELLAKGRATFVTVRAGFGEEGE